MEVKTVKFVNKGERRISAELSYNETAKILTLTVRDRVGTVFLDLEANKDLYIGANEIVEVTDENASTV